MQRRAGPTACTVSALHCAELANQQPWLLQACFVATIHNHQSFLAKPSIVGVLGMSFGRPSLYVPREGVGRGAASWMAELIWCA